MVLLFMASLPANAQTKYAISYDGLKIAYNDVGSGDTTLVFVHGWSCDRTYWSAQVEAFSRHYRTISIDLAGHGESDTDRIAWTMQGFGEDIGSVMDTLRLENVILVGHSAAGYSTLEAARTRPQRVIALIGVDAFRFISKGYFERRFSVRDFGLSAVQMRQDYSRRTEELVRTRFFGPNAKKELVDWVARDMASAPVSVAVPSGTYAFNLYRSDYLQGALADVGSRIPIVAINAAERGQIDSTVVQAVAPRFTVRYMSDVGHFLMMEKPEAFNTLLSQVLNEIKSQQ